MEASTLLREAILDELRSRNWRAGQRLPTERAFCAQYGLSRSSVRRVLQDLKRRQLITQTVGSGTYVSEFVHQALSEMAPSGAARAVSPAELMSARMALEPALIDMVIGHATAADFERMDECNRRAEQAATVEEFEHWDTALHEAIAMAAHNGLIAGVFRLIGEARAQGEWGVLKRRSATPERRLAYQQQHRALVAALRDRDADRARMLCQAHLALVRTSMLGC